MTIMPTPGSERRFHHRVSAIFPVTLSITARGVTHGHETTAVDISQVAIQISGNGDMIRQLMDQEFLPHTCDIVLRFPDAEAPVSGNCQLINYRRLSQHAYAIVLSLAAFSRKDLDFIKSWITSQR